jgi:uncharacterized protein (TIGR02391 family)
MKLRFNICNENSAAAVSGSDAEGAAPIGDGDAEPYQLRTRAKALLALGSEELGMILLGLCREERGRNVTLSNYEMSVLNVGPPAFPHNMRTEVAQAIGEAWQWLLNEGLMTVAPDQPNGWFRVTKKGSELKSTDLDAYRHGSMLPVDLLHPRLSQKVRAMFVRGEYATAVVHSFREIELAVRKATGLADRLTGVSLMREAFHPQSGKLTNKESIVPEREAVSALFSGAMGHCRNPPAHRDIEVDRLTAAQLITFASYLLTEVESREKALVA